MRTLAVTIALGQVVLMGLLAGGASAGNNKPFTFDKPQPKNTEVVAAQKDLEAANVEYNKAKGSVNTVVAKLRHDFDQSPDYTAALAALKEAQTAYDAARAPVLEAMKSKPDYLAAKTAKEKADQDQETARGDASTSIERRTALATDVMNAGNKVTQMEAEALAAEPKVVDAKAKMVAAQTKVNELVKAFQDSLKSNAEYTAAKAAEDQSTTKLEAAKAKAKQANATYSQQMTDWNKQRADAYAQWQKQNKTGG